MKRFTPGWTMTLLVAAVVPALVALGFWQLERAAEKRALEAQQLARVAEAPRPPPAELADADFLRVRLTGHYRSDEHYLVDNRPRLGRPGYWVVSRFQSGDGRIFLVNRGWLAAPGTRERLPDTPTPSGAVELVGVVWPDTGMPPLLAPDPWPEQWPKRVQRLDVARMAQAVPAEEPAAVPAEVRLEPGQPGIFDPVPVRADFHPERHRGYAVQWFGLALALIVAYVVFGLKGGPP